MGNDLSSLLAEVSHSLSINQKLLLLERAALRELVNYTDSLWYIGSHEDYAEVHYAIRDCLRLVGRTHPSESRFGVRKGYIHDYPELEDSRLLDAIFSGVLLATGTKWVNSTDEEIFEHAISIFMTDVIALSEFHLDLKIIPLSETSELFGPLFRTNNSTTWASINAFQNRLAELGEYNAFFRFCEEWYRKSLNNDELPIELIDSVANIEDSIWNAGPEAVAAEIERIQAEHLNEASAYHETFTLDDEARTFSIQTHAITNQGVLKVALERTEDALDDVLFLGNGNGLTANTVEARILQRLFKKYADDPRRVVFDFSEVLRSIQCNVSKGEFPENDPLKVLISALGIGRDEICEAEPDLRAELDRSFEKALETTPTEDEVLLLTQMMRIFPQVFDQRAADDLREDLAEVLHGEVLEADNITGTLPLTDQGARLSVRRRLAARVSKLYSEIRIRPKLRAHYDSDRFKENRVVGTYGGILGLLATVGGILGRLLGIL